MSNHISWLDIAVLGSGARVFFLAKAEIEKWPILGNLAKGGAPYLLNVDQVTPLKFESKLPNFKTKYSSFIFP